MKLKDTRSQYINEISSSNQGSYNGALFNKLKAYDSSSALALGPQDPVKNVGVLSHSVIPGHSNQASDPPLIGTDSLLAKHFVRSITPTPRTSLPSSYTEPPIPVQHAYFNTFIRDHHNSSERRSSVSSRQIKITRAYSNVTVPKQQSSSYSISYRPASAVASMPMGTDVFLRHASKLLNFQRSSRVIHPI